MSDFTDDQKTIISSLANEKINDRKLVSESTCILKHKEVAEVKRRINWVLLALIMFIITLAGNFIMQYSRANLQAKMIQQNAKSADIQALTSTIDKFVHKFEK